VGCGVGLTITTFGNGGAPVFEVTGANRVDTVVEGAGDGLEISTAHIETSGDGSCLGGRAILSGRMPQMILPAGDTNLIRGETMVSRDGTEVRGWIMGEGTPNR
jgi:hypothetical protein